MIGLNDMTTLLHTSEGSVPMHTLVEEQAVSWSMFDDSRVLAWEALRDRCMTIGCREALDHAMRALTQQEGGLR